MSCNGECACSCKQEIAELRKFISSLQCGDITMGECVASGLCDCGSEASLRDTMNLEVASGIEVVDVTAKK